MKNKYSYVCPFCKEEVASLTTHVKKAHPEEIEKGFNALAEGTQQRMKQGYDPISHMGGNSKKDKKVEAESKRPVIKKPVEHKEKTAKPKKPAEGDAPAEKPGSFLDCLDDL